MSQQVHSMCVDLVICPKVIGFQSFTDITKNKAWMYNSASLCTRCLKQKSFLKTLKDLMLPKKKQKNSEAEIDSHNIQQSKK